MAIPDANDAGALSAFLADFRLGQHEGTTLSTPCGNCSACCSSGLEIFIDQSEVEVLALLPHDSLVPLEDRQAGNFMLRSRKDGRCPMLGSSGCTTYDRRPRTCRSFDCRIFTATGIEPPGGRTSKVAIRARNWTFDDSKSSEGTTRQALDATVKFLKAFEEVFIPYGIEPGTPIVENVAADLMHLFLEPSSEVEQLQAVITELRRIRNDFLQ